MPIVYLSSIWFVLYCLTGNQKKNDILRIDLSFFKTMLSMYVHIHIFTTALETQPLRLKSRMQPNIFSLFFRE